MTAAGPVATLPIAICMASGVPIVPGFSAAGMTDDEIARAATDAGFPLLIKPSAGGGGKGMQEVHDVAQLADAVATARRGATAAFGGDTLLRGAIAALRQTDLKQMLAQTTLASLGLLMLLLGAGTEIT